MSNELMSPGGIFIFQASSNSEMSQIVVLDFLVFPKSDTTSLGEVNMHVSKQI